MSESTQLITVTWHCQIILVPFWFTYTFCYFMNNSLTLAVLSLKSPGWKKNQRAEPINILKSNLSYDEFETTKSWVFSDLWLLCTMVSLECQVLTMRLLKCPFHTMMMLECQVPTIMLLKCQVQTVHSWPCLHGCRS